MMDNFSYRGFSFSGDLAWFAAGAAVGLIAIGALPLASITGAAALVAGNI